MNLRIPLTVLIAISLNTTTVLPANAELDTNATLEHYVSKLTAVVGTDDGPTGITLRDAIMTAIENNPGILAKAQLPVAAKHGVLGAQSLYEPSLKLDVSVTDGDFPRANDLSGAAVLTQKDSRADLQIDKLLRSGANLSLVWNNARLETNSSFQILSPQYQPTLGLNIEAPLLRDLGGSEAKTTVLIAKNASASAAAEFEVELADFLAQVINAYWDYTSAGSEVEVNRHSYELAEELVRVAQGMVDIGMQPPIAQREARAEMAAREEQLLEAENNLAVAAKRFQQLVAPGIAGGAAFRRLKPAEQHSVQDIELEPADALRTAMEQRAELRVAALDLNSQRLTEKNARSQLWPKLNLFGNYTLIGLSGDEVVAGTSSFTGSYGDALDLLADGDFSEYTVGVKVEVPLANADARSEHGRSKAERRRAEHAFREVATNIALEVSEAVGDVASAFKRVAAARLSRELAAENMKQQKRRYELGVVTTTDILDFQDKLTRAEAAEVKAVTDHAKAVTSLLQAKGTLLESYDIEVEGPGEDKTPWWALF